MPGSPNPHAATAPAVPLPSKHALILIFATIFLDLLGVGILVPVIPFLVRQFDSDALTVGLLALSFSAAQFLFAPALGVWSDRYGRRPVLLISLFGTSAGYFLFGFAGSLLLLFIARIIDGATGGNISTAQAYIADISPPEDRAKNFGLVGAAFGLGFIIGPALGGLLAHISLSAPAYCAGILTLITVVLSYFFLPETLPADARSTARIGLREVSPFTQGVAALRHPALMPLMIALFFLNFAFSGLQTNFAVFTFERLGMGPEANAMVFAYIGVIAVLMQGVIVRRLSKIFEDRSLAAAGLFVMALGFLATAFAYDYFMIYLGATLTSAGSGLTTPTLTSMLSQEVSPREQGWVLGASQSFASLARIAGPVWAGVVYDLLGRGAPYWTGSVSLVLTLLVILFFTRARTALS